MRLSAAGQYAEAAERFRALLEQDPAMTDGWLQLAQAYERLHRPADALNALPQAVIERDPRNPAALTGATAALLRTGRIDDARAHAELAVDVAPAIAHEMLARIAVHQGDEAGARRHARLAETADPTLPMSAFVDGMILNRRGDHAAAAERLLAARTALDSRTEQLADVNFLAGDSLAHLDRHAEAERLFRAELAVFPGHVRARAGLAMLYKATGRDADAARAIDDLLRHAPTPRGDRHRGAALDHVRRTGTRGKGPRRRDAEPDLMSKRRPKQTPSPTVAPACRSKRTVVAALVLIAVAGTAAALWFTRRPPAPVFVTTADQNVLLITIDTLRGDALGAYGGRAATPHLDRLAAEGLRFTFAHAARGRHASLAHEHPDGPVSVRARRARQRRLPGRRVGDARLAEMARDKGFATGAFVGAFPLDRDFGLDQGFGVYDDLSGRDVAPSDFAFSERPATGVVESARPVDRTNSGTPWFAWVHVFDPHSPYRAAAAVRGAVSRRSRMPAKWPPPTRRSRRCWISPAHPAARPRSS